jgi:hypothetical protein
VSPKYPALYVTDRIIEKAAELLLDRLLEANSPPNRIPNHTPPVKNNGGRAKCPHCGKSFHDLGSLGHHVTSMRKSKDPAIAKLHAET